MTEITYITTDPAPTQMWVPAGTAHGYEGWRAVQHRPYPPGSAHSLQGYGEVLIEECEATPHTYSPELCALHRGVTEILNGVLSSDFVQGTRKRNALYVQRCRALSALYDSKDLDYHGCLTPREGESLEDVHGRIVDIFKKLRDVYGTSPEATGFFTHILKRVEGLCPS